MDAMLTDHRGGRAAGRARLSRTDGAAHRREPAPARIDPLHLCMVLLLAAITLASGLATLAQALRWT